MTKPGVVDDGAGPAAPTQSAGTALDEQLWLNPSFRSMTHVNVYAGKQKLYVVGTDLPPPFSSKSQFRLLQIDRTNPAEVAIVDDNTLYSNEQIQDMLLMIDAAAGTKAGILESRISGYGIFGFVRFLQGYYLILITKRRIVGHIGTHSLYKIEDTSMIQVWNPENPGKSNSAETRYLKMFQNVDMSSNFYYSYTYDLTRPLQANFHVPTEAEAARTGTSDRIVPDPDRQFVWNEYLLKQHESKVHSDWCIFAIYGFLTQSAISVMGQTYYITLIARRLKHYAGTRFLKRGCDFNGRPANSVETEQILHDGSTTHHGSGKYTSWLQMRASVPCFWSQDLSTKIKPPISIDRRDPFASSSALHFDRVISKYGAPVIVLNLVKKKERRPREEILSSEFADSMTYLNQFLEPKEQIRHIEWDMHRTKKSKDGDVIQRLIDIGASGMKETGFFHAGPELEVNKVRPGVDNRTAVGGIGYGGGQLGRNQSGIIRTNCVDCLDRTNTAQFMLGLGALGHQLYALGALESPTQLGLDCPAYHILEEIYEDHGDTMALQYGGSQLVNRIQTYRKSSPWKTQSKDILATVARYYSNSFTDAEKQAAINLFLGVYCPEQHHSRTMLWNLESDKYLHFPELKTGMMYRPHYIKWCSAVAGGRLPEIETCRRAKNDGAPAPPSRHESTVLGEGVHDEDEERTFAENADGEGGGDKGIGNDASWVDVGRSNNGAAARTRRRTKIRPPLALKHPYDPSVPRLAHPASITDQLTQRNGYLSIRQSYLQNIGVPTNAAVAGSSGGGGAGSNGTASDGGGSSRTAVVAGSAPGSSGGGSGGGSSGGSGGKSVQTMAAVLSSKDGPEWFNANVKQLLKSWQMKDAVPQDYITAALLVAARQGLHFHDSSRMPAPLPEPTLNKEGGCTSQLQNFYDPQSLTELSQGLVGTMVNSTALEFNSGMLNFHAFREITKESQASETDLNQHSRSSSQAQADKDDDSEDSGDDVVVISWGEGLNSKTTIKQQLLDIDDDGDVEQFGSKSVYGLSIKTPAVSDLACFNKFIDTEDLSTDHNTTVYGDTQYGQYNPNQMYPSTPSQRGGAAYAGAGSPATLMYRDSSSKPSKSGRPSRPLSSYGQGIAFDGSDQTQAGGGGGGGGGGDGGGSIGNKGSTDSGGGGGGSSSAQYQASNAESSNIRGRSGSGVVKMPSRLQRAHSIMSPTRPGRSNTLTSTGSSSSGPAFHRRSSIAQVDTREAAWKRAARRKLPEWQETVDPILEKFSTQATQANIEVMLRAETDTCYTEYIQQSCEAAGPSVEEGLDGRGTYESFAKVELRSESIRKAKMRAVDKRNTSHISFFK